MDTDGHLSPYRSTPTLFIDVILRLYLENEMDKAAKTETEETEKKRMSLQRDVYESIPSFTLCAVPKKYETGPGIIA